METTYENNNNFNVNGNTENEVRQTPKSNGMKMNVPNANLR